VDTFYLATSVGALASPVRRSRSRAATHNHTQLVEDAREAGTRSRRARSKSRARILYAAEPDIVRAGNGELSSNRAGVRSVRLPILLKNAIFWIAAPCSHVL
jgi:hypothetical protein